MQSIETMFQNLYKKNFNSSERQETRRQELLEQQKLKRLEDQDRHRHYDKHQHLEEKSKRASKNTKIELIHLQLSEWFREKPENLDDWILVPCPKGQRCFVMTGNGKTKMFSKNKKYRGGFLSLLPGGGLIPGNGNCILDCIYCKAKNTFYVLDAIHYCIPLVDCDAEFRFFWLKSKFSELDGLEDKYKCNDGKNFELLNSFDISTDACLSTALQKYPLWEDNQPQLDGFLFYHKKSHYVFGTTPLVCWLFPYMVPDILQMTVSNIYKPPVDYCRHDPWKYMDAFDKETSRKKSRNINRNTSILNETPMEEDGETVDEFLYSNSSLRASSLETLLTTDKNFELEENY